jgi:hypothetical protein
MDGVVNALTPVFRQQNVIGSWGWRSGFWESDGANQCGSEVARVEGRGR